MVNLLHCVTPSDIHVSQVIGWLECFDYWGLGACMQIAVDVVRLNASIQLASRCSLQGLFA